MTRFLLRRLGQSIVLLLLVSIMGFALLHLIPGGPLSEFALTPGMSPAEFAQIAHQMGLDRPLPVQYLEWLRNLLAGDWGRSYRDQTPVLTVIGSHLVATLELMVSSTILAVIIGNALLPMITVAGLQVPTILGGALVAETVFTWPGMGRLFLDSLGYRDYPVVMGLLMVSAILTLLGNLMADILYVVADPRVRLS